MLQIRSLTKYYTKVKPVISNLNLTFPSAGLNIIVGKSGCGKTTLLNMIGTMDQDYIGSIELDGVELSTLAYNKISEYRNYDSAYIFQQNSLFEHLTVGENIQLALDLQNKECDIEEVLEKVGLKGFSNRKVKYLSGGERQRVAIARVLAKDAKIVLADEPTSALDSKNSHRILKLLKEISKDKLVIVVTHDTKKAFQYADRIIRFVDGTVVEDEVTNQVEAKEIEVPHKRAKFRVVKPIFIEQLKKSFFINLFVFLLLTFALTLYNIAIEQEKVKVEYDEFAAWKEDDSTDKDVLFSEMRTLMTQEANHVDLFNILKVTTEEDKYAYFKEQKEKDNNLTSTDYEEIESLLKGYNLMYSNPSYGNVAIENLSTAYKLSVEIDGMSYYWSEIQRTNYGYYIFSEDNEYDLLIGDLPKNDNEILITDTIATQYLLKNGLSTSSMEGLINFPITLYDIYAEGYRNMSTTGIPQNVSNTYYYGIDKDYIITGIINTYQLDLYEYNSNKNQFDFIQEINANPNTNETYMNPGSNQPYGYIVFTKEPDARTTYAFYEVPLVMDSILVNGDSLGSSKAYKQINTFHGYTDYRGISSGYIDDLQIDFNNRLLTVPSGISKLNDKQIIIGETIFSKLTNGRRFWRDQDKIDYYIENLEGTQITLTFNVNGLSQEVEFTIVGLASDSSDGIFYVSEEMYDEVKSWEIANEYNALTLNLNNVSAKERQEIINKLYESGYILNPVKQIPGAYLDFIPGQGEIEIVDMEGFSEIKNISLYDLFSEIYNNEKMNSLNSTLEIANSIYKFTIFMACILSLGFLIIKEINQRKDVIKFTQIGVKTHTIVILNSIFYLVTALFIGFASYYLTQVAINYINSSFTLHIGTSGLVYRIRAIFTSESLIAPLIASIALFIFGIISSIGFVKKNRR